MLTVSGELTDQVPAQSAAQVPTSGTAYEHEWLTATEMASWLRLNRKTVYECAAQKLIPCERFKGALRFHRPTILAWLARSPSVTHPAPRARARRNHR
jgi:excisionase family DNA binding protein